MHAGADADNQPPSFAKWLAEPLAIPKIVAGRWRALPPVAHSGNGQPVLVIPGMLSGDGSTAMLRRTLNAAGYRAYGWGQPFNNTISEARMAAAENTLAALHRTHGQKVIVIGWSLGGFYARVLARRRPEACAMVVTLGTPFSGDRHANNAWRLYELLNNHPVDSPPIADDPAIKPPVCTIAVWSPNDGVIAPAGARGLPSERDRAVEVPFRHFELGSSRRAAQRIAALVSEYSA